MTSGAYDNAERGIIGLPEKPHFLAPDIVPGSEEDIIRREQQPTLPGMEDQAHELPAPVAVKKPSKKHKKKARSLRDMAYETQKASNVIMRDEMERGVHQPRKLDEVLTEMGVPSPGIITTEALAVINEGPNLTLSFSQWAAVQQLVETAYRRGFSDGKGRAGS